jgi:hypothetical protein
MNLLLQVIDTHCISWYGAKAGLCEYHFPSEDRPTFLIDLKTNSGVFACLPDQQPWQNTAKNQIGLAWITHDSYEGMVVGGASRRRRRRPGIILAGHVGE